MGLAAYEIIGNNAEWRVRHDGKAENTYETKEAAFDQRSRRRPSLCARGMRSG